MLPEGWKETTVGKGCSIKNNIRTPINENDRKKIQGIYPYYGPTGILGYIDRYQIDEDFSLIGEDGDHFLKYKDKEMTIFYSGKACINNHAHVICNSDKCLAKWFYLYFLHRDITKYITRQGAKRFKLNKNSLESIPIVIPPLPEQEKIAAILSTWDKAISTADALLENSCRQKKALMQQLLTGKRRLPGFTGEWDQVKLKKIGTTYAGLTGKSKEDFGQGSLFIPYLNVFKNSFVDNTNFEKVTIYDNEKQNSVKYGDILFTISSETPHEVGMSSVFLDHIENIYLNSFCFGFRMKNFSTLLPQYARFLFRGNNFRGNIASLAQGATRYNLSKTQFLEIAVLLPPLDEQRAIAAVLDAADREISLLEQKAARLREEKKALMQQLLTGKRRVKI